MIEYQDPQITQYTIQSERTVDDELNFGDLRGEVAFGFFNSASFTFPEIPARLGYIEMSVSTFSYETFSTSPIKVIDIEPISPEKQPYAFFEGGSLSGETSVEGLKVPVNSQDLYFNKITDLHNNAYINLSVKRCDQASHSVDQPCATDDEELQNFLDQNTLVLFSATNFIDFDNVEPDEDPV